MRPLLKGIPSVLLGWRRLGGRSTPLSRAAAGYQGRLRTSRSQSGQFGWRVVIVGASGWGGGSQPHRIIWWTSGLAFHVSVTCRFRPRAPSQAPLWIDPDLLKFGGDTGQGDYLPKNLFVWPASRLMRRRCVAMVSIWCCS